MNKQQMKDAELCDQLTIEGKEGDCLFCSCRVCLADVNTDIYFFKRQLLEKIDLLKEDISSAYSSIEEMYGAETMLKNIVNAIENN